MTRSAPKPPPAPRAPRKWLPHVELEAKPGGDRSRGTVDLFVPLGQSANNLFFALARGVFSDEDTEEGNFGLGFRRIHRGGALPPFIWGVYGFYDIHDSEFDNTFRQFTIGGEILKENFELRANGYFADSDIESVSRTVGPVPGAGTTRVVGTQVQRLTGTRTTIVDEVALPGFDVEAGVRLPGPGRFRPWLFGGYFNFERGDIEIEGPKARVEFPIEQLFGRPGVDLTLGGEIRDDNVRGTDVSGFFRLRFLLGGKDAKLATRTLSPLEQRMTRRVIRDDDVVTRTRTRFTDNAFFENVMAGPGGGTMQPLNVFHVAEGATGNCTQGNPCSLAAAFALAGVGDVIILRDLGGTINTATVLALANNMQLLGTGGTGQVVTTLTTGDVLNLTGLGGKATLNGTNAANNVVQVANGNRIAGFTLSGGNTGIFGTGANGTTIDNMMIANTAGNGVNITNAQNTTITNTMFTNIGGTAVFLNNDSATLANLTVNGTGGSGLQIDNNTGTTTLTNITIDNAGGDALSFANNLGTINVAGLNVTNPGGDGLNVTGAGTFGFTGTTAINNPGGDGLDLTGTNGATFTFENVDITGLGGGTGLNLAGGRASVTMNTLDITGTGVGGSRGIDLSGTMGNLPVTITNGGNIANVGTGVVLGTNGAAGASANAQFNYGGAGDIGGVNFSLDTIGLNQVLGTYAFNNSTFSSPFNFPAGANLFFVGSVAAGTGDGSSAINRATIAAADAIVDPTVTFVLVNDNGVGGGGPVIDVNSAAGFTLENGQTLASFGNGATFNVTGAQANVTGANVPAGGVQGDPFGNGAATLTNTAAGNTVEIANNNVLADFTVSGTQAGVNGNNDQALSTAGLTVQNTGGAGISLANMMGVSQFSNTTVNNAGSAGGGVNLATNAGATFMFTNGLDIDTGGGTGFSATGGGLVEVAMGAANIDTTTGTALNLNGVTIDNLGLNFNTVDKNGATGGPGIDINAVAQAGANGFTTASATVAGTDGLNDGIEIDGSTATFTFQSVDIDNTANHGIALGFNNSNNGTVSIESGAIDGTGNFGILSRNTNLNVGTNAPSGVVFGNNAAIGDIGILALNTDGAARTVNLLNNTVLDANVGINVRSIGTGTLTANLADNDITATSTALDANTNGAQADQLRLSLGGGAYESANAVRTVDINGTNANNSLVVTEFLPNANDTFSIVGNGTGQGARFNRVTFDADPGDGTFNDDPVTANATGTRVIIGQNAGARVASDGLRFELPSGTLNLTELDVFNTGGTGLFVDTKTGGPTTFALTNTVATSDIDTVGGPALFLDPLASNLTFGTVRSANSGTTGVHLDAVSETVGATNAVTIATLDIDNSTQQGVLIENSTGDVSITGGDISGATGDSFRINGGTGNVTYSGNITHTAAGSAAVSVLGGHNTGTVTFNTGNIVATAAANTIGLLFNNADGTYNFNGTTTLGNSGSNISITNGSAGSFFFGTNTSVTNSTNASFFLNSSSANVTYNGTITDNDGAAASVNIANNTGGTANFNGAISSNNGGVVAINLVNNTGATVNFTGGLDVDTTSGTGFNATGGGTVSVQGAGNTVNTTTGTGVNIANTDISIGGVTFQSINVNGAVNGIVLNNTGVTGGAFTVTGGGSGVQGGDGSGGTIQNTTGSGILLTNVQNVSFTDMIVSGSQVHGLQGTTVTNLDITSSRFSNNGNGLNEHGIFVTNLLGTAANAQTNVFDNIIVEGSEVSNIEIVNTTSTTNMAASPDVLVFSNSVNRNLAAPNGSNGILVESNTGGGGNEGNIRVEVVNSLFENLRSIAINLNGNGGNLQSDISGSTIRPGAGGQLTVGIQTLLTGDSTHTFDWHDNVLIETDTGTPVNIVGFDNASFTGSVRNNGDIRQSAANGNGNGIDAGVEGNANGIVFIGNNTIQQSVFGRGISLTSFAGAGRLDATLSNNVVNARTAGTPNDAIEFRVGNGTVGETNTLCVNLINNSVLAGGVGGNPATSNAYALEQAAGTSLFLQGYAGGANDEAAVEAFVESTDVNPGPVTANMQPAGGGLIVNVLSQVCNTVP